MPSTINSPCIHAELFEVIAAEYREKGASLPVDTTEIVHA